MLHTIVANRPGYLPDYPAALALTIEDAREIAAELAASSFEDERVTPEVLAAIQGLPGVVALPDGYVIEVTPVTEDEVRESLACNRCGSVGIIMAAAGYAHCPTGR